MDVTELRVALFSGNYNYIRDGANQALNRLSGYLLKQGAKVRIYSPKSKKPAFPSVGKVVGVPSMPFPGRGEYRLPVGIPFWVQRDLQDFGANIFHVASPEFLGHRAVTLARKWNIPAVASVHTRFETYMRYYNMAWIEPVVEAILRRFYRRCDAIFAPSESMAQLLREQRMSYDVGIWTRGVDTTVFTPKARDMDWRRSIGLDDDMPAITFLGRLVMEKGLDVFAETIDILRQRGVRNRVVVIGEGPAREWFERRLPANAIFAGFQRGEDLGRALASSDLLFNPSVTETFGNVTLEAMACGLPVVAARATGSSSLIEDNINGRLIEPGRNEAFARAIQAYCDNSEIRLAAGEAGRKASELYEWDRVNQQLVDAYLRLVRLRSEGVKPLNRAR
ncbi:glycosyltransferase involved in cell wall biosynthesis [Sphingomonas vulcanisoli]|uniref:Glycosyltransferase involved in cell wall biosynthesis n=1 Tax=Sphingomonas vulcanisoli TaxID=1658060 RepID=A0ABX0TQ36_9SPHN|nr:glycosyltransferase family 1 protein [Sphingomonas vulcanisoli]NIJ06507.1 glycosyltransferase involved in cell wall biosynthesis [Sphingomonas vulcanisoli]